MNILIKVMSKAICLPEENSAFCYQAFFMRIMPFLCKPCTKKTLSTRTILTDGN